MPLKKVQFAFSDHGLQSIQDVQQNNKPCTSFRAETSPLYLTSHKRMLSKQVIGFLTKKRYTV